MCGICGIWSPGPKDNLKAMVVAMHHRGPDDNGIHYDAHAALGMTRLAIVDTSNAGHQPMASADGEVWLVYNGETYNYADKRKELERQGFVFKSDSDTEVVLQLYLRYGDDFLHHLHGMFALAILDKRKGSGRERLLLARDPLGIKPLLYSGNSRQMVFASEIKAILASGLIERKINPRALHGLLAHGSVAQPDSIIEGVQMLLPGHKLIIESGTVTIQRFWQLSTSRNSDWSKAGYSEQVQQLRQILEITTKRHMVSDVPVGAFLSGGIDSTVLVGLMAQQSSIPLRTFSVGFGDEGGDLDEADAAGYSASYFGTNHTKVLVTGSDVRDRLVHAAAALDQPSVDGVNAYFVSAAAAGSVKVAISGTGGDEPFAGYPWFQAMAKAVPKMDGQGMMPNMRRLVSNAAAYSLRNAKHEGTARVLSRIRASGDFLEAFSRQYRIFGSFRATRLLSPEFASALGVPLDDRSRLLPADVLPDADTISRTSALCLRGYLQNQILRDVDAVSMAHSLEVRVPFLDTDVIDFALALPDSAKSGSNPTANASYADSGAKRILIDATRDLLPPDIQTRKKSGFTMPFNVWLSGPLRDILEDTTSTSTVASRGIFDPSAVGQVRQAFLASSTNWFLPWTLMMTELWCRGVIDAPSA